MAITKTYTAPGGSTSNFNVDLDFKTPLRGHRFTADFEGFGPTDSIFSSWKTISGFTDSIQQEAKEYREGGFANPWNMWIPDGKATPGNTDLEFEKGMMQGHTEIIEWVDKFLTGELSTYIKTITVTLYDAYGTGPVASWMAHNCFPTGYENSNTFDASSADLWMEKLKVKCEYITRES